MGQISKHPFRYTLERENANYVFNNAIARELKRFLSRIKTEFINSCNLEGFINRINGRVDVIIDIRHNTYFKKEQGFTPEDLKENLERQNLEYFYVQDLGNPYHKEFQNDSVKAKQAYLNYLEKEVIVKDGKTLCPNKALTNLFTQIAHKKKYKTKTFCLMCYCRTLDPAECHRFWLKESLINIKRLELGLPGDFIYETPHYLKTINTSVILSIKPHYAEKILSEQKRFEFRKKIWKKEKKIKTVFLYATAPVKKIVGFFTINKILKENPKKLWSLCKKNAGISKSDFFKYFDSSSQGYAIETKNAIRYDVALEKETLFSTFSVPENLERKVLPCTFNVPQNFMYISNIFLTKIKEG